MTRVVPASTAVRRLGIVSSLALLVVGVLYVAVLASWLVAVGTPREPIGDPHLAVMEVLTMVSALALVGWVAALRFLASPERVVYSTMGQAVGTLAAGLTLTVHFVQLTAVRQLWSRGDLPDYRLIWPSPLFAAEYLAWDVLVGLTMILAAVALGGGAVGRSAPARTALIVGGIACLMGSMGPLSGRMAFQSIAVFGYAVALPVSAAFTARLFAEAGSTAPPAASPS